MPSAKKMLQLLQAGFWLLDQRGGKDAGDKRKRRDDDVHCGVTQYTRNHAAEERGD